MKIEIETLLKQALTHLCAQGVLPINPGSNPTVTRSKDPQHGEYASNLAMTLAKSAGLNPRDMATAIVEALPASEVIDRVEIAGPGFINFFLNPESNTRAVAQILEQGSQFGLSDIGKGKKILIEFVSANPTGPLHVGHGRGAAYGAALADLLAAAGFEVEREYYVNDAGRQMDILAVSVWLRYLELCGESLPFPVNGYRGSYVKQIAEDLFNQQQHQLREPVLEVLADLPKDEIDGGDKEIYIDALIQRARKLLQNRYDIVFNIALNIILDDIKNDLAEFGVHYQYWFSERSLEKKSLACLEKLQQAGYLYEKDGALWFRSSDFGDEKDRVVQRDNGQPTYFTSDIAYHLEKIERGYDRLIDIWGADHHGYIPRVNAAMQAMGLDAGKLDILLVQFAILYRGKEKVSMSTRSGEFVTLRELRHEVGNDAARFFYIMRRSEQHMDFDLELAKSQSNDNPVYYVQYAHARICSVFRQLKEKNFVYLQAQGLKHLDRLTETHETALIKTLGRFPEVIENSALTAEPHQLTYYLRELANAFHSYYNAHQFLVDDADLRNARLALVEACGYVLRNALSIIGVSAPESM
ncbi:MAG: arginine--tRNA ligase [Gammaproteobacteria bacterium]|nr:arginine--tRNA ligase [Gammaproteobacteria bacterium]